MPGSIFSFKDQYCGYAEYHNNKTNQIIHTIFVPAIMWSSCVMLTIGVPGAIIPGLPFNVTTLLTISYATYYTILHPVIGGFVGATLFGMLYSCNLFVTESRALTGMDPFYLALAIHVTAWICQFIGHGVFEKRAPALLDNLLQAVVLAYLFVWTHTLFDFGLYPDLHKELQSEVGKRIAAFRKKFPKKAQ